MFGVLFVSADGSRWFDIAGADGVLTYVERTPAPRAEAAANVGHWARLDGVAATDVGETLIEEVRQHGPAVVEHIDGDFSFVVCNASTGVITAARDPFGHRPLYVYRAPGVLALAVTPAFFRHVGLPLTPDPAWMSAYIVGASKSHTVTAYAEVTKLAGGHRLTAQPDDNDFEVTVERWHEFADDPPWADSQDPVWVADYRKVLDHAVGSRIITDGSLGVETSGGIDSSTCLGIAAELWPRSVDDIHAFGYVANEQEPEFILETSTLHNVENNVIVDRGRDRHPTPADRMLEVLGYPFEHGNGPGHEAFYVEAERRGVKILLSGFGGDEAVTLPGGQLDRELIDRRKWRLLWGEMFGPWWQRPLRLANRLIRNVRGGRETNPLAKAIQERWRFVAVNPAVAERYDLERRHFGGGDWDAGFRTINEFVLGNRVLSDFVPTRMENCSLLAAAHGIDYAWPLLDPRLVQQYLSTPAIEKRHRNMGRLLHRRAIAGSVPDKVRLKQSKDMGASIAEPPIAADRAMVPLPDLLHPMLADMVDLAKLAEMSSASTTDEVWRTVNKQRRNLALLHEWLTRYHSDDFAERSSAPVEAMR